MAKDHAEVVKTGLRIKKAGNAIVSLIGGREIHPVNVRLGGVYRAPLRRELASLRDDLERARDDARALVDWTAGLAFPHVEMDYEYVALHHPDEYPMNEGRIVSTGGLDVDAAAFETHIQERHALHSTALHATMAARGAYVVGPMARFHVNRARLTPQAREAAAAAGLSDGCFNPFKSIIVRAVEILFAFEEALRLIDAYEPPDPPHIPVVARACTGQAATEAPRGLLFHRYDIDADGRIAAARVVPPTSQNQKVMEQDLKAVAERFIDLPDDALQWRCEQAIRNYDPCISCSTHFLKVVVDRGTVLDP